jgi:hypothetical protein
MEIREDAERFSRIAAAAPRNPGQPRKIRTTGKIGTTLRGDSTRKVSLLFTVSHSRDDALT